MNQLLIHCEQDISNDQARPLQLAQHVDRTSGLVETPGLTSAILTSAQHPTGAQGLPHSELRAAEHLPCCQPISV